MTIETVTLNDIRKKLSEAVYFLDDSVVEVVLATVLANQMPGDSVSLHIVGPSSSAKTEVLRIMTKMAKTYHCSKITSHTFISGFIDQGKKKKDEVKPSNSLLTLMSEQGKNILVFKDFTSILTMHNEERLAIMGQIREIADGSYVSRYGTGEVVEWHGTMGFITAVTNAIDEHSSYDGALGERFLKYRMQADVPIEISEKAMGVLDIKDSVREQLADMTRDFMLRFEILPPKRLWEESVKMKLINLCVFTSHIRSAVIEEARTGFMYTPPVLEGPGRMSVFLAKMGEALAMIREEEIVGEEVYKILKKLARDTSPQYRLKLMKSFYMNHDLTKRNVMDALQTNEYTARKTIYNMNALGIIDHKLAEDGKSYLWNMRPEYRTMIDRSEIFILDKLS